MMMALRGRASDATKSIIMVQAGKATDAVIDQLAAAMDEGDIIIDGGNALYTDTIRREKEVESAQPEQLQQLIDRVAEVAQRVSAKSEEVKTLEDQLSTDHRSL